jgi:hypothetical protein
MGVKFFLIINFFRVESKIFNRSTRDVDIAVSTSQSNLYSDKEFIILNRDSKYSATFKKKHLFFLYLRERFTRQVKRDDGSEKEEIFYDGNCYFYILDHSSSYSYSGEGVLYNETTRQYVQTQTESLKPGYIMIKALESGVECALSGLNGAYYRINELQHVYFTRAEGDYILQFRNNKNEVQRYLLKSGRGYFIVNSSGVVDMETNQQVPLYINVTNEDVIANEARLSREFSQRYLFNSAK